MNRPDTLWNTEMGITKNMRFSKKAEERTKVANIKNLFSLKTEEITVESGKCKIRTVTNTFEYNPSNHCKF